MSLCNHALSNTITRSPLWYLEGLISDENRGKTAGITSIVVCLETNVPVIQLLIASGDVNLGFEQGKEDIPDSEPGLNSKPRCDKN